MTGCNGRCCESFPMVNGTGRMTLHAIKRMQEIPGASDYDKYVDMLLVVNPNDGGDLFTCRYHDPVTKRCTDYAGRPVLCSSYPYSRACSHCWLTHIQLNGRELGVADAI